MSMDLVQPILFGKTCGHADCRLVQAFAHVPGIAKIEPWNEWITKPISPNGVFILLGAQECFPDANIREWCEGHYAIGEKEPVVRSWPILIVSPHSERWIRDLHDDLGIDLMLEKEVLIADIPHEASTLSGQMCESDLVLGEVSRLMQRLLLSELVWNMEGAKQVRSSINYLQALSVLQMCSRRLHNDVHEARGHSGLGLYEKNAVALSKIKAAHKDLRFFISKDKRDQLLKDSQEFVQICDKNGADAHEELAVYLDESIATLKRNVEESRRSSEKPIHVFVVDDNVVFANKLVGKLETQDQIQASRIDFSGLQIAELVLRAQKCGGDPSEEIGILFFKLISKELDRVGAKEAWLLDCTRFVLVIDVRLDVNAPDAGIYLIRRIKDSYPFVTTIALTVRRRLGYILADEGADGYITKSGDDESDCVAILENLPLALDNERFLVLPGVEYILQDIHLSELLSRKFMMGEAKDPLDPRVRLIFCGLSDIVELIRHIAPNVVIGIVVGQEANFATTVSFVLSLGRQWNRKIVIIRLIEKSSTRLRVFPSDVNTLDELLSPRLPRKFDKRWTLLIPKVAKFGEWNVDVAPKDLSRFRQLIEERFGGATMEDAEGVWLRPQDLEEIGDKLLRVEILGRGTDSSRGYLFKIAQKILSELKQEEIFLQEHEILNWTLSPSGAPIVSETIVNSSGHIDTTFAIDDVLSSSVTGPHH